MNVKNLQMRQWSNYLLQNCKLFKIFNSLFFGDCISDSHFYVISSVYHFYSIWTSKYSNARKMIILQRIQFTGINKPNWSWVKSSIKSFERCDGGEKKSIFAHEQFIKTLKIVKMFTYTSQKKSVSLRIVWVGNFHFLVFIEEKTISQENQQKMRNSILKTDTSC